MPRHLRLEHPTRRVYRTGGDEMHLTSEHGHAGRDLDPAGCLFICPGKLIATVGVTYAHP